MNYWTTTLVIYGALTELASKHGSESFTASQRSIMQLAGIGSDNTLRKHVEDLCEMRLLKVDGNRYGDGLRAPSTYTLLTAERSATSAERSSIRVRSIIKKETKERRHATSSRTRTADAARVLSFLDYGEEERRIIEAYHITLVEVDPRWLRVTKFSEAVSAAIADFTADFRDRTVDDVFHLFRAVADGDERVTIPKKRTLVRLLRDNRDTNLINDEEEIPF